MGPTGQWDKTEGGTKPGAHAIAQLAGAGGARPAATAAGGVPRGGATAAARWDPRTRPHAAGRSAPANPSGGANRGGGGAARAGGGGPR